MATKESGIYTRWIGKLFGLRRIIDENNSALPERQKLEVRGMLFYDNPANASSVLELASISSSQHGNQPGGALHTVATTSVAGFMSAADKTKLNNATASATPNTLVLRNNDGGATFGAVSATEFTYAVPKTISYFERPVVAGKVDAGVGTGTRWFMNDAGEPQSNGTSDISWLAEIKPPTGSTLKSITAVYSPATGHAGLPADQPGLQLAIIENGVATTYETPVQDNALDVTAYQVARTMTKTFAAPLVIEFGKRYVVVFTNEHGANALVGLRLHQPAGWTVDVSEVGQ